MWEESLAISLSVNSEVGNTGTYPNGKSTLGETEKYRSGWNKGRWEMGLLILL
jgi:hypothetical protein